MKEDYKKEINKEIKLLENSNKKTKKVNKSKNNKKNSSKNECDINIENSICIGNLSITSLLGTPKLSNFFKFETNLLENSLNSKIRFKGKFKSGIGINGEGNSAFFDNSNYLKLENHPSLNKIPISYTFWIYINEKGNENKNLDNNDIYCPILIKGEDDTSKNSFLRNPGIFIKEGELSLRVFMGNSDTKIKFAQTIGSLNSKEWNMISVVITQNKIKIFINGVLDGIQMIDDILIKSNDLPLYLGTHLNYKNICNLTYYIDNLKIYSEELKNDYIFAESGNLIGSLEPNYIKIGCINCNYQKAVIKCKNKYHLCTNLEINSGGLEFIKRMNWDKLGNIINDSKYSEGDNIKGTGFCCKN